MRRKPLSLRKRRSISFRFLYKARSYSHGSIPIRLRRYHRDHPQIQRQLPCFIAFIGPVHQQRQPLRHRSQGFQQGASRRRIVRVAGRKRENYSRSSIRGNHMNLGVPSASRFADGLRSVFFNAPVPSGCTFTEVESRLNASILMRTICSCCSFSNTRSSTPFFDQRFIRM